MLRTVETTRYTTTIPTASLEELKKLVNLKAIPSVNFGIRQAVDEYLKQIKKKQYENMMKSAASDEAFLKRTLQCMDDFHDSDSEVQGEW